LNPFDLLKNLNIDELKKKGEETLAKLKELEVTGEAGGGFVKVKINGEFEILSIEYEDNEIIKEDLGTFKDLIMSAHNAAVVKMRSEIQTKVSGNLIPGLF